MKKTNNHYNDARIWRTTGGLGVYLSVALTIADTCFTDGTRYTALSTCLLLLPVVLVYIGIAVMPLLWKRKEKKLAEMKVAESNRLFNEMAENIVRDYKTKKRRLVRLRRASDFLTFFLMIFPLFFLFACGSVDDPRAMVIGILPCTALLLSGISHIKVTDQKKDCPFYDDVLKRDEYPVFYEIADKAAGSRESERKIFLIPISGTDIAISHFKDEDYILIGSTVLQFLSRDEFHAALLHEFAHSEFDEDGTIASLYQHFNFITNSLSGNWLLIPYRFFDLTFVLEKSIFDLISSVYTEQYADRAMLKGNTEAAGSMLVKLEYLNLYDWEAYGRDFVSIYKEETPPPYSTATEIEKVREAFKDRSGFWNELIGKEIQSRNATHPIVRSRLECLGIKEIKTPEFTADSEEFAGEKNKLLALTDSKIDKQLREEDYAQKREEIYLKPLKIIEEWEAGGCQLTPAGYREVADSLSATGRCSETVPLYEKAIAEFSDAAAAYAHFAYGIYLVHRFDRGGIYHLWKAIDTNENYINAGLDAIAVYACFTGDNELLEAYRAKAMTAGQNEKDYESALATMDKKDNFEEEHLPDGQLDADIAEMLNIGGESIEKIWLVRKTVCGHFRSQYVVKLTDGSDEDTVNRIMNGIFNYLDTVSDWNYGLFYFENVKNTKFYRTPGSLVYEKKENRSLSSEDKG